MLQRDIGSHEHFVAAVAALKVLSAVGLVRLLDAFLVAVDAALAAGVRSRVPCSRLASCL